LALVKINLSQRNDYKFVLKVDLTGDIVLLKLLYKEKEESKRWEYSYIENNILESERYFKDNKLKEEYRYNRSGHKTKETVYLNNEPISITIFNYNKEGVVDKEEILNTISQKTTIVKYKYDKDFRIKQIEKSLPDNNTVFWEAFFNSKGIIIKEFYTLKDEIYTFYYNEDGQELKGEVMSRKDGENDKVKINWENFYASNGKRKRRVHNNFLIGKRVDTLYNKNFKEIRVETYYNDTIFSIEEYEYNDKNFVIYYKKIHDLNLIEEFYTYDDSQNRIETKIYLDKELKKDVFYNLDGSRKEIVYSKNKKGIAVFYNSDGKLLQ